MFNIPPLFIRILISAKRILRQFFDLEESWLAVNTDQSTWLLNNKKLIIIISSCCQAVVTKNNKLFYKIIFWFPRR